MDRVIEVIVLEERAPYKLLDVLIFSPLVVFCIRGTFLALTAVEL